MDITLHPSIAAQIEEREDVGEFVNSIVHAYLSGAFIRKSDVAGMVVVNKSYRRLSAQGTEVFDAMTHEFKGIAIEGSKASDSIFIPSEKLHDLIQENQIVLVLKSKRSKGIRLVEEDAVFTRIGRDSMA